jgi:hypothetical protein
MRKLSIAVMLSVLLVTISYAKVKTITLSINQPNIESCITAIDNQFTDCYFKIFPNPGNGLFTVEVSNSAIEKEAILMVHDISGKVIINEKINISKHTLRSIDLTNNTKGTYFLSIVSENKQKYSANLIIF